MENWDDLKILTGDLKILISVIEKIIPKNFEKNRFPNHLENAMSKII